MTACASNPVDSMAGCATRLETDGDQRESVAGRLVGQHTIFVERRNVRIKGEE